MDGTELGRRWLERILSVFVRIPLIGDGGPQNLIPLDRSIDLGQGGDPTDFRMADQVLNQIVSQFLQDTASPFLSNPRQIKSLVNTLHLYLMIARPRTKAEVEQIAAFIFADRFDSDWLDALCRRDSDITGPIASAPGSTDRLAALITSDRERIPSLYRLVGRQMEIHA